jgi:hypothetical protein
MLLPIEIMFQIFDLLPLYQVLVIRRVCLAFYQIGNTILVQNCKIQPPKGIQKLEIEINIPHHIYDGRILKFYVDSTEISEQDIVFQLYKGLFHSCPRYMGNDFFDILYLHCFAPGHYQLKARFGPRTLWNRESVKEIQNRVNKIGERSIYLETDSEQFGIILKKIK